MASITHSDIISWSVSKDLSGGGKASVVLDNTDDEFSPHTESLLGQTLEVKLSQNDTEYSIFKGKIADVRPSYSVDGVKAVQLTLTGVSESLSRRPVTTETIESMTGADLMAYLLDTYGAMSSDFRDVSVDGSEVFSSINISEDSIFEALRKIAEACNVEIFLQGDGKIYTGTKKTNADGYDYELSIADIEGDTEEQTSEFNEASVCRVRGRYQLLSELSADVFLKEAQSYYFTVENQPTYHFLRININDSDQVDGVWLNARIVLTEGYEGVVTKGFVYDVEYDTNGDRFAVVKLYGDFTGDNTFTTNFAVKCHPKLTGVESVKYTVNSTKIKRRMFTFADISSAVVGKRRRGMKGQISTNSDENQEQRIEVTVEDSSLVSDIGVRYMEVDNPYIQDSAQATTIGERALAEAKMSGNIINLTTCFIPDLREVNKVVKVPLVHANQPTGQTYKCLLNSLTISYNAGTAEAKTSYNFIRLDA